MTTVEQLCARLVGDVDHARACRVVDLADARVIASYPRRPDVNESAEAHAEILAALLAGPELDALLVMLAGQGNGPSSSRTMDREIALSADGYVHLARTLSSRGCALVLTASAACNLGLGWALLRETLPRIELAVTNGGPPPDRQRPTTTMEHE